MPRIKRLICEEISRLRILNVCRSLCGGTLTLAVIRKAGLPFGINSLRSDEMPYFGAGHPSLGAFVQPQFNENYSGSLDRCS